MFFCEYLRIFIHTTTPPKKIASYCDTDKKKYFSYWANNHFEEMQIIVFSYTYVY